MQQPQKLCIYHKNCPDGIGAALAVNSHPDWRDQTEYLSAQYGDEAPDVTGKEVIIVDFSYSRETLIEMDVQASSLIVLDHHKTAQEALQGLHFAKFDMEQSGAMLAWKHLHPGTFAPELIRYVQDRDLWLWQLDKSREVSAALASYPMKLEEWEVFLNDNEVERLKLEGEAILRYQQVQIDRAIYQWQQSEQYITLGDVGGTQHCVPILNTTTLISEICGKLADGFPFAATYFDTVDGKRVYSLRVREGDFDVSAVASNYGGGGHPKASGFSLPYELALPMHNGE